MRINWEGSSVKMKHQDACRCLRPDSWKCREIAPGFLCWTLGKFIIKIRCECFGFSLFLLLLCERIEDILKTNGFHMSQSATFNSLSNFIRRCVPHSFPRQERCAFTALCSSMGEVFHGLPPCSGAPATRRESICIRCRRSSGRTTTRGACIDGHDGKIHVKHQDAGSCFGSHAGDAAQVVPGFLW